MVKIYRPVSQYRQVLYQFHAASEVRPSHFHLQTITCDTAKLALRLQHGN